MISTDLRGLIASMKAHVDADMLTKGFFAVFEERLRDIANRVQELEQTNVPAHSRGRRRAAGVQLELIEGGRS